MIHICRLFPDSWGVALQVLLESGLQGNIICKQTVLAVAFSQGSLTTPQIDMQAKNTQAHLYDAWSWFLRYASPATGINHR